METKDVGELEEKADEIEKANNVEMMSNYQ